MPASDVPFERARSGHMRLLKVVIDAASDHEQPRASMT
jgi:hypothetical protein